jgi:hypothetical protein
MLETEEAVVSEKRWINTFQKQWPRHEEQTSSWKRSFLLGLVRGCIIRTCQYGYWGTKAYWLTDRRSQRDFDSGLDHPVPDGYIYVNLQVGGGLEYFHLSPVSRKRRRKVNSMPGGMTGPRNMATEYEGVAVMGLLWTAVVEHGSWWHYWDLLLGNNWWKQHSENI